jgi:glucose/arabinose dehydrogenase
MSRTIARCVLTVFLTLALGGCFAARPSAGGGQTKAPATRRADSSDVILPPGYRIERVASGLTFPTGVAFDENGVAHVVEAGYSYGEKWTTPRLIRVERDGSTSVLAEGDHAPWTGVAFHDGAFYVAQGGLDKGGGRIVRIDRDGKITPLIDKLPGIGDHHTNGPAVGPDGMIYFAIGCATNSGVVGEDSAKMKWLERHPKFCDIPAKDIKLAGRNFTTKNPLARRGDNESVVTGAYVPFGTPTEPGQLIRGKLPANGAIMRIPMRGGDVQLVAWGLRNPYGLAFAPDGSLYASENSYDVRGSRPVYGTGDLLWRIENGLWYGWPDFHGELPLTWSDHFQPPGKPAPQFLLAEHPNDPPKPVAKLGVHSSSNGLDFAPAEFGFESEAFVAQFGDMAPDVGKVVAPVGFKVVRVDTKTGVVHDFAANRGRKNGPASLLKTRGLERPTALRFAPDGRSLYVVDFGVMTMTKAGPQPREKTGVVWRITRDDGGNDGEAEGTR